MAEVRVVVNEENVSVVLGDSGPQGPAANSVQHILDVDDFYTLQLSDNGKHIYGVVGNHIVIPTNISVPFPIGTTISFVSASEIMYFAADDPSVVIWGAGLDNSELYWLIPPRSMATILKIEQDVWIIQGVGLEVD